MTRTPCPDCEGRGRHDAYRRERDGGFTDTGATSQCETCDGSGEVCAGCGKWFCPADCEEAAALSLGIVRSTIGRDIIKSCKCGRSYTRAEWQSLPLRGHQDQGDDFPVLELRDCPCRSTLGIEIPNFRPPKRRTPLRPAIVLVRG